MKIKLISKDKPIISNFRFRNDGFSLTLIEQINSGKQIEVDKVPRLAWKYVEEVKQVKKIKKGDK
tara:strand:+ start:352 stop:546 length:195 start_codon:yes stop_codon:yes gene_type:complete